MPSSTWLKMPSITPRMPPSANALAPSCAPSGMPPDIAKAEALLNDLVANYRDAAPKLVEWLEENVPRA